MLHFDARQFDKLNAYPQIVRDKDIRFDAELFMEAYNASKLKNNLSMVSPFSPCRIVRGGCHTKQPTPQATVTSSPER